MEKEEFTRIRKKLGFTQVQLASKLHLSSKSISDYEAGKAKIPYLVATIMKMYKLLNT